MNLRFVTRQVHAYIDYPVAIGLMAMPFVLGLGVSTRLRNGCPLQPALQHSS